jgi:antirestriction protein ArdC
MYSPWLDQITMPFRHQFALASGWASTLLHEFSHATGHVSRLGRDQTGTFASESYAREELIAEIGSYMLCTELAVSTPGLDAQHASYVGSWIKALKSDPKEIFRAAAAAQRVFNFAMEFDRSPLLREAQEEARKIQPVHQAEPVATERKAPRRRKGTPEPAQEMSR